MTTTSSLIVMIALIAILCFFIYLEFKFKDNGSHLELVEIAPLNDKNVEDSLKKIGAKDIRWKDKGNFSFNYDDTYWWLYTDCSFIHLLKPFQLDENIDREKLSTLIETTNRSTPGVKILIDENMSVVFSCATFTDNYLGIVDSIPVMVKYIYFAYSELYSNYLKINN